MSQSHHNIRHSFLFYLSCYVSIWVFLINCIYSILMAHKRLIEVQLRKKMVYPKQESRSYLHTVMLTLKNIGCGILKLPIHGTRHSEKYFNTECRSYYHLRQKLHAILIVIFSWNREEISTQKLRKRASSITKRWTGSRWRWLSWSKNTHSDNR